MKRMTMTIAALAMLLMAVAAMAEEPKAPEGMQMPEMGPPKEIKELEHLVGTWSVASKFNMSMDPKTEQWMESKATATYAWASGGAALTCTYSGDPMMPGMPNFNGLMVQAYDRELKQWQATWVDNMSGRISLYTGSKQNGRIVLMGEDMMMGQTYLSRITVSNEKPTSFDWKMEASMDGGKTWVTSGTAVYTKK